MAITKEFTGWMHGCNVEVFQIDVDFGSLATVATGTVDIDISSVAGVGDKVLSVCYEVNGNDDIIFLPMAKILDSSGTKLRLYAYNPTAGALDPTSQVCHVTIARKVVAG
jgi:hypothetical protein